MLAVAGLVSVHDHTWTTDRETGARRWSAIDPQSAASLTVLSSWSCSDRVASMAEMAEILAPEGNIATVVAHFVATIGLRAARG